jgi:hypothetical protein
VAVGINHVADALPHCDGVAGSVALAPDAQPYGLGVLPARRLAGLRPAVPVKGSSSDCGAGFTSDGRRPE